jgi:hypothetical protein
MEQWGSAAALMPAASVPMAKNLSSYGSEPQVLGYPIRSKLFDGEQTFFRQNPTVTGMAAEDGTVILNPHSNLQPHEKEAVARNEALRLHMRDAGITPSFGLTPEQQSYFKGTAYEGADKEVRQTIVARILSGDPSIKATDEQRTEAQRILQLVMKSARQKP